MLHCLLVHLKSRWTIIEHPEHTTLLQYLAIYPYINLAVVCLFVQLSVTFFHPIVAGPNDLRSSPNLHQMETFVSQTD